jgi:hypothetical protein
MLKMLAELPKLATERMDIELPSSIDARILAAAPTFTVEQTESALPRLRKALMESELPICAKLQMD